MKTLKMTTALMLAMFLAFSHGDLFAQYQIQNALIGTSGGDVSGEGLTISSTIGQPVAGSSTGSRFLVGSGFWQMPGIVVATSVEQTGPEVPGEFSLEQNYPNPFNPGTVIQFSLPQTAEVQLKVYDMLGREVATLINEQKSAGSYNVTFNAASLSSGVYFYRIIAGNYVETRSMTFVK